MSISVTICFGGGAGGGKGLFLALWKLNEGAVKLLAVYRVTVSR